MLWLSCRRRIGFPAKIAPGQLMLDRKFTVFISNTNEGGELHLCNMEHFVYLSLVFIYTFKGGQFIDTRFRVRVRGLQ